MEIKFEFEALNDGDIETFEKTCDAMIKDPFRLVRTGMHPSKPIKIDYTFISYCPIAFFQLGMVVSIMYQKMETQKAISQS